VEGEAVHALKCALENESHVIISMSIGSRFAMFKISKDQMS